MLESSALRMLARSVGLLSDATFEGVLEMAPALVLEAVPEALQAVLTVTHPDHRDPVRTVATRRLAPAPTAAPGATAPLSLDIVLTPGTVAGSMVLSTDVLDGLDGAAQDVAQVMVTQIESVLRCACAVERAAHLGVVLEQGQGIGVAVGLIMASHGLDREAASTLLRRISQDEGRPVADVAGEVVRAGTAKPRPRTRLRLMASDRPLDRASWS